jgi:hypothetical protein
MNWTQLTCEGFAPLFKQRPCENYTKPPPQCSLLKEKAITKLCEKGRCVFSMVGFVQEKLAERFDHLDGREEIDLKKLWERLRQVAWKDSSNPAGWLIYVKKVVHSTTVRALAKRRLMPEEKTCGTCAHLPKSNPRVCQISGDAKRATDRACDDYHFLLITIGAGSEFDSDELSEEGEAKFVTEALENFEAAQKNADARMDVESLRLALAKRVEKEKRGTKKRAVMARQYELFLNLRQLAGEGYSDNEAFRLVSEGMGVNLKMISRDLAEIREFLGSRFK